MAERKKKKKKKTKPKFPLESPSNNKSHYTTLYKYGERTLNLLGHFHFHVTFCFAYFDGHFNKTIIAVVEYEMITTNSTQSSSLAICHLISTMRSWKNFEVFNSCVSFSFFLQNP